MIYQFLLESLRESTQVSRINHPRVAWGEQDNVMPAKVETFLRRDAIILSSVVIIRLPSGCEMTFELLPHVLFVTLYVAKMLPSLRD